MTSAASVLRAGFGVLIGLLLVIGGVRLAVGQYVASSLDTTIEQISGASAANAALLQALADTETGLRDYQLTGERLFLETYQAGRARYPAERAAVTAAATHARLRGLVADQTDRAEAWLAFAAPIAATSPTALPSANPIRLQGAALFDRIRVANARVAAELDRQRAAALQRSRVVNAVGDWATLLFSIIAAVGALVLGARTSRQFLDPLENIRETLVRLGHGDRTARCRIVGPPEARQVVGAFNEMADEGERLRSSEATRGHIQQRAHELGAKVRSSLDADAILDEVVAGVGTALSVDYVYVRLTEDGLAGVADRLWCRESTDPMESATFRAASDVAHWPSGGVSADGSADDPPTGAALLAATGARSCLATVFVVDGESAGLLVLAQLGQTRHWSADERALVEAVAADTGRGLHLAAVYGHQRELAERFRDLDRQKTDFISTVSHELRTPLTSILGYLEILLSGDQGQLSDAQQRSLKVVERNAERLRELVGDLLTLSRIGSGNLEMAAQRVEVANLVAAVNTVFAPVAAGAGLTMECATGGDLAVVGDARQLERVLLNVVGNAIKFTPVGGSIRLTARAGWADRVVIEVADTGIGIPQNDQQKLFQPFQRASNAVASAIQGTGLGLAIARSIVERHGGEVTLSSAVGEGTTLTLVLPRAAGPASAASADRTEAAIRALT